MAPPLLSHLVWVFGFPPRLMDCVAALAGATGVTASEPFWVAVFAMRPEAVVSVSAPRVFCHSHCFEMIWIAASGIAAKMVKREPDRDGSLKQQV